MPDTKLYDILGLEKGASEDDIKKAYRRLAREYHPDKNPNEQNGDMFKKISFAYNVLSDPQKRSVYDRYGLQGLRDGLSEGLFGEPPGTPEQQLFESEDILCDLLLDVTRSMNMNFTQTGIQDLMASAARLYGALYRRDFISSISETVKLSVQIYKALPDRRSSPGGRRDRNFP
ncbi:uncharacterized protein LOC129599459 [Paramacrobiotus metropolitanus]|uniref:uncharacterized protein LOC129599459 n=1 Tax=Paramacrobiotus metropolitanus TaxID=2943436 RepID=UPI002445BF79|nr:uncharacterized protein LOC129599459 [Paramacrobiotus metropolitanus]XP_055353670.1 uncharacterized protein LOC129599459 [Paramacrobiotus metropolitanus]